MKLRNKQTGEIKEAADVIIENMNKNGSTLSAISIDEIKEEWEDYEESKEYWYINFNLECIKTTDDDTETDGYHKSIGNYFDSRKEAEKAVEKLKAWKRLKDKGFRFRWIDMQTGQIKYSFFLKEGQKFTRGDEDDLMLLFGGEE